MKEAIKFLKEQGKWESDPDIFDALNIAFHEGAIGELNRIKDMIYGPVDGPYRTEEGIDGSIEVSKILIKKRFNNRKNPPPNEIRFMIIDA